MILPVKWRDPHLKPVCIHLAGTGDHVRKLSWDVKLHRLPCAVLIVSYDDIKENDK